MCYPFAILVWHDVCPCSLCPTPLCSPLSPQIVLRIIKEGLAKDPTRWTRMAKRIVGVSEETTTGVKRLYEMQVRTA